MQDINATILINTKGKTKEELFKNLEYSRRKNIKKELREGIYIEKTDSEEDYKKCYEMYAQILKDGNAAPFPYEFWRKWAKEENWDLFAVRINKKSAGYFSAIKITKRYYGLNSDEPGVRPRVFASDKKFADFRVNDFIYWNTILYGLNNQADFVDLGGYQIKPRGHLIEVNKFKERWGGEIFYYNLEYPFYKAIARKLVRNIGFFWWLNEKLKKSKLKPTQMLLNQNILT